MAPTLIDFSQLSKTWKVTAASVLTLMGVGGAAVTVQQVKNSAGIITLKQTSDGGISASGSILNGSGSATALHTNPILGRISVGKRNPKTALDVLGTVSGSSLTISNLRNCDTIDTDAQGNPTCGTDAGGSFFITDGGTTETVSGNDTITFADGTDIDVSVSETDTVTFNFTNDSGYLTSFYGPANCDTVDTDEFGNFVCGSDGGSDGNPGVPDFSGGQGTYCLNEDEFGSRGWSSCPGGEGSNWSNTGALTAAFDARYLNTSGDTTTGSLVAGVSTASQVPLSVVGAPSQTANLLELKNSAGQRLSYFTTTGALVLNGSGGSAAKPSLHLNNPASVNPVFKWNPTNSNQGMRFYSGSTEILRLQDNGFAYFASIGTLGGLNIGDFYFQRSVHNRMELGDAGEPAFKFYNGTRPHSEMVNVIPNLSTVKGLTVKGATNQTANLFEVQNSSSTALSWFNASGSLSIRPTTGVSFALSASGNVLIESLLSGATIRGFGLGSGTCNGSAQKLLWNATSGRFECGSDQDTDTNTTYTAAQGLQLNGTAFRLLSSFSGSTIWATSTLASSGTIAWEGAATGRLLTVSQGASLGGSGLTISATGSTVWNPRSRNVDFRLRGATDAALLFLDSSADRIGIGTALPKAKLDVVGAISGSSLTVSGLNSASCDVKSTNGVLSCGTDSTGSGLPAGGSSGQILVNQGVSAAVWRAEKEYERHILFGPDVQAVAGSGVTFVTAFSGSLTAAHLQTSGVGSGVAVQVWFNGLRAFSTPISTDNKESSSTTAATPAVISAANSRFNKLVPMRIDVTSVGTYASTGVVLTLFFDKRSP